MVLDFYGLKEQPFGVTPDSRFLFLSPTHREALASIVYGVSAGRGFTALISKPGMGKTTLLFEFLQQARADSKTVFLFQPQRTPQDLLRSLLEDLGLEDCSDFIGMHKKLNGILLDLSSEGKRLIVVLDEAQTLDEPVLEAVRMLSNFETPREKLLHIVLSGQPQLADKLMSPRLIQLKQRVSTFAHLKPLNAGEIQLYIDHRLRTAGYDFTRPLFTKQAHAMIASHTEGIPRNINNVCFNAMSLGYVAKQRTIDMDLIREAVDDLDLRPMAIEPTSIAKARESIEPPTQKSFRANFWPSLRVWSMRVAAAMALIITLSWVLVPTTEYAVSVLASTASQNVPGYATVPTPANQEQLVLPGSAPAASTLPVKPFVSVLPNETLYRIGIENFGRYDDELLARLRKLNPWLKDPTHIEAGQKIWIRATNSVSQRR
jgi:general secretion pathway protein A